MDYKTVRTKASSTLADERDASWDLARSRIWWFSRLNGWRPELHLAHEFGSSRSYKKGPNPPSQPLVLPSSVTRDNKPPVLRQACCCICTLTRETKASPLPPATLFNKSCPAANFKPISRAVARFLPPGCRRPPCTLRGPGSKRSPEELEAKQSKFISA